MRWSQLLTAASCRNEAGTAVRRGHRVLQRVFGVFGAAAGQPGDSVQLPVVAVEQLLEGIRVACDVGSQQFGVAPLFMKFRRTRRPKPTAGQ